MIQYLAEFPCPNCQHRLRIKPEYLGKTLRCKYCAHEFLTESGNGIAPATPDPQAGESDKQAALRRVATLEGELQSVREELAARMAQHSASLQEFQGAQARFQSQLQQAGAEQQEVAILRQKLSAAQLELEELRVTVTLQVGEIEQERRQAEADANGASVDQPLSRPPSSAPRPPSGESPARDRTGAPLNRLLEKAQSIRAQLEASSTIKERIERLNAELEAARAEKDRLTSELQTAATEAAQFRTQATDFERSLAEATKAHSDLFQAYQGGQAQWEGERQTLLRHWEERHQSCVREAEQRLAEEKTRIDAERRQLQEQFDAARQAHEQESAALRIEVEQLGQELTSVRRERDTALNQLQLLSAERNHFAAERDEIDNRYKDAIERFRADFGRLTQAWQQSRHQEAGATEQNRTLAEQIENLRAELDQERRRANDHEQTITTLQQAVETARADATAERERNITTLEQEKARAEAERGIWQEEQQAAQRRFDEHSQSLQSEVERLREEIAACKEALEIVGLVAE